MRTLDTNYGKLVETKRKRDAELIHCPQCDWVLGKFDNPYWSLSKSAGLHERGIGHKVRFYEFERTT